MQQPNDPLQSKISRPTEGTKTYTYTTYDQSKQPYPKQTLNTTLYTGVPLNYNYRSDNRKILESSGASNTSATNPLKNSSVMSSEHYKTYSSNITNQPPSYTSSNAAERNKYSQTTENKLSQTANSSQNYPLYTPSYTNSAKTYTPSVNLTINTSINTRPAYTPSSYTPTYSTSVKSGENVTNAANTSLPKTTRHSNKTSHSINLSGSYSQAAANGISNSLDNSAGIGPTSTANDSGALKGETVTRSYSYHYSLPKPVQKIDNISPALNENKTRTMIVPTRNITLSPNLTSQRPAGSNLYTNSITAALNQSSEKLNIPRVNYEVSNVQGTQKNTPSSINSISKAERPFSSYEPKYKPQSLTDLNAIGSKPLYSPTTHSYSRYTNNSLTQVPNGSTDNNKQAQGQTGTVTNNSKPPQPTYYQSKSANAEDLSSVVSNEEGIGEKINKVPTSPIALKRAGSPNIRDSGLMQDHLSTPSKTAQAYNDENESFKPPSRTSPDKYSLQKTPEGRAMLTEKSPALTKTLSNGARPKMESFVSPGNPKIVDTTPKYQTVKKVNPSLTDVDKVSEDQRTNNSSQSTSKASSALEKKAAVQTGIGKVDLSKVFTRASSSIQPDQQTANSVEVNGLKSLEKTATLPSKGIETPLKGTDGRAENGSLANNTGTGTINGLSSKYVPTQKVDLLVSPPPSKNPSNERSTYSGTVRTEEDLPSLRAGHFKQTELRSQHIETESSGKKELKSAQKPLAITFLKNIFNRASDDPSRHKCTCDGYLKAGETCKRARKWILRRYKESEFEYLEETYQKILHHDLEDENCTRQIKKDLLRTYPKFKYFSEDGEGIQSLERILNAFAKYDPQIGYVQGMNFIAASLLYHAEEYIAFWLLATVVETFEMRDIFLPKLPGLTKHCQIVDILIASHLPAVYEILCRAEIRVEMYCSEWIFSLFAGVVPLDVMGQFYDRLLEQGWPFFYKVILAFLQHFQTELLDQNEFTELMMILKSQNHLINGFSEDKSRLVDWNKLFKLGLKIEVDSKFICSMHSNFDVDNQSFKTQFLTEDPKLRK